MVSTDQTIAVPGMFGSLIIALPSWHQGGDVLVTNAGNPEIKAFGTAETSGFDASYMAW